MAKCSDLCTNDTYIIIPTKMLPKYMTFEKSFGQIWIWIKLKNPAVGSGAVDPKDVKLPRAGIFFLNKI